MLLELSLRVSGTCLSKGRRQVAVAKCCEIRGLRLQCEFGVFQCDLPNRDQAEGRETETFIKIVVFQGMAEADNTTSGISKKEKMIWSKEIKCESVERLQTVRMYTNREGCRCWCVGLVI
jgi:hypothetical protein